MGEKLSRASRCPGTGEGRCLMNLYRYLGQRDVCPENIRWCHERALKTPADYWDALRASKEYEQFVWLAVQAAPREARNRFLIEVVTRTIRAIKKGCRDRVWNQWATNWLSGADRSETTAQKVEENGDPKAYAEAAAARMAREAVLAKEESVVGEARDLAWLLVRESVALWDEAEDKAKEQKRQADFWRKEPNPFRKPARALKSAAGKEGVAVLTKEEKAAIATLKSLAKRWPKTLWLFSADGVLHVMRKGAGGLPMMTESGGVDRDGVVDIIDIRNDGGDW